MMAFKLAEWPLNPTPTRNLKPPALAGGVFILNMRNKEFKKFIVEYQN